MMAPRARPAHDERGAAPAPGAAWYRQLWPWLLMVMPATALVGGAVTFWLAATSNNALVVDDYYREGKAINRQLERDRAAREMGLGAQLARTADDGVALLLLGEPGFDPPDAVMLRLVHATRAEFDRTMILRRVGQQYLAPAGTRLPLSGRWTLLVEEAQGRWRLTGEASGFDAPVALGAPINRPREDAK
ncbi:MAG: FixH family protein [Burkholderiaceae bacterium]|nr:FixH family protein [Burkholderiaceae bacterium]